MMNIVDLDYNLYKHFIAVYENRNIAKAAEQLVLTASAVGMRIKELERQLGLKLFIAHARGVHPTKDADELYAKVAPMIAALNSAGNSIKDFCSESTGHIKIGCPANIASSILVEPVVEFIRKYPKVKIEITSKHRTELTEMLGKRDIDILVNKMPIANPTGNFKIVELCPLPRSFYASKKFLETHNLGNRLTAAQLANLPLILPCKSRADTQSVLAALNRSVDSFTEIASGNEMILAMVLRDAGIGYVNESCIKDTCKDRVEKITIENISLPEHKLAVAYNVDNNCKAVKAFLELL